MAKSKINWSALVKTFEDKKKKDVQSFFADSYNYLKGENDLFSSSDYNTAGKNYETFKTTSSEWKKRADNARSYIESKKGNLSEEDYKSFSDYLDNFYNGLSSLDSAYNNNVGLYGQYETESDYNNSVAYPKKYSNRTYDEIDNIIANSRRVSDEERDWLKKNKYLFGDIDDLTDLIAEKEAEKEKISSRFNAWSVKTGQAVPTKEDKDQISAIDDEIRMLSDYRTLKETQKAEKEKAETAKQMTSDAVNSWRQPILSAFNGEGLDHTNEEDLFYLILNGQDPDIDTRYGEYAVKHFVDKKYEYKKKAEELTDEEKEAYNIFFNGERNGVYEKGTAQKYLEMVDLNKRWTETKNEETSAYAKENPFESSIKSILMLPEEALVGLTDVAVGLSKEEIDPYDAAHQGVHERNTIRSAVSEDMGDLGRVLYNASMSLGDMGISALLGGQTGASILLGVSAAENTILSAKQRGLSDGQAVLSGVAAGVAEWAFERIGIEKLFNIAKAGRAGLKNAILDIMKQMGVEGLEEIGTDIANSMTDDLINGKLSEMNVSLREYMAQGMGYEEASKQVANDYGKQLVETFVTGAASGGMGAIGATTVNSVANRFTGNDIIKGGTTEAVLNQAEGFSPDSATAYRLADYKNKTKNGGKASPSYIGAVYRAMANDSYSNLSETRKTEIRSYIENQLTENGIEASNKLVDAIEKKAYAGENLTKAEESLVNSSEAVSSLVEKFTSDESFKNAPFETKAFKEAAEKVVGVDQIALATNVRNSVLKDYNVTKNAAEISSIEVKDNGDVYLVQDGKTVEANKAKINTDTAFALAYSESMSPAKKRVYFANYNKYVGEGKMSIDDYHDYFDLTYTYGQNKMGIEKAKDAASGKFSDEDILNIYKSGLKNRKTAKEDIKGVSSEVRKALGMKDREAGKVDDSEVRYQAIKSVERRAIIGFAEVLATTTGRNVKLFDSSASERRKGMANGYYDPKTNTIYIDVNAGMGVVAKEWHSTILSTLSHELVHIFKTEDFEGYNQLKDLVLETLSAEEGKSIKTLIDEDAFKRFGIEANKDGKFVYKKNGEVVSAEAMKKHRAVSEEELVARSCEDMLAESRLMKEFIQKMEDKESGLAQKFSDFLGRAIEKLKEIFENIFRYQASKSKEAESIRKAKDDMLEKWTAIKEQYDSLLERRTETQAKENTSVNRGVMFMSRGETESIKNQIRSVESKLSKMDVVSSVQTDGFKGMEKSEIAKLIDSEYAKFGNRVDRQNFGIVLLEYNQINKALNYLYEDGEKAALLTVPRVLKRGIIADQHLGHKERGVNSITFAAPVEINGIRGNVGVVVQRDGKTNRFKTLRILLPNGKAFEFVKYKEADSTAGGSLESSKESRGAPIESASKDSIPNSAESVKQKQLEIINSTNPAPNTFQTWIRKTDDIRTWDEVLELDDEREGQFVWGDFSRADAEQAKKDGTITVYSSYPIKNGVFVSTSRIQAQEYAGGRNGRVYSKTIPLTEVAWINGDEGQYAKVSNGEDVIMKQDRDSEGNQLTADQLDYFKDSKIVDANGNLKVMYHGSKESFTVFDKKKAKSGGTYGNGFYFTDSDSHAKTYGETYAVYLNITNPLQNGTNKITKDQLRKFVEAIADNEDYGIENYGYGATVDSVIDSVYGKSDFAMIMDINISCVGNMVEAIELFNEVNGTNYDGIVAPTETVAFYPEQIKSVANKNPTTSLDIRYQNRYWHTGMSNKEVTRIEELAKHQQNKPENHIDSMHKWLYDEREEKPYFALYSLSDTEPTPTILYASKGEQAKFENIYAQEYSKEKDNAESGVERNSKNLDTILHRARSLYGSRNGNVDLSLGRESRNGNAEVYNRQRGRRPSKALLDCLENIEEIQSRGESSRVLKQDRVPYQSARDILLSYAEDSKNVKARSEYLNEYVDRVKRLDLKNRRYEDAVSNLATAVDSGNKEKIDLYQKRVENLEKTINQMYADLQAMEDSKELKAIVRREKAETKKQTKREGLERLQEYRDNQERRSRIDRIEAKVSLLGKKILANNKELHIPDALKEPILDFIEAIDYTSKKNRSGRGATVKELRLSELLSNARKEMMKHSMLDTKGGTVLFSADIWEQMDAMEKNLQGFRNEMSENVLLDMSTEQLRDLDFFLSSVTRALNSIERSFTNSGKATVYAQGEEAYKRLLGMKDQKQSDRTADGGTTIAGAKKAFTWGNMTPQTAFNRLGKAGEAIYRRIVDGWGEFAFKSREILAFSEQNWNAKQVKAWEDAEHEIEFEHDGKKEKGIINDTQLMYLYLVDKREQGRLHLDGLGITLPEQGKSAKSRNIKFNYEQRQKLYDKYIPEGSEQRKVADAIQRFFVETCAKWGNETSLVLYGYTPFTEENYVPLVTDITTKGANAETSVTQGMYAILNIGCMKSLQANANNPIVATNLFDVFANHSADMAKYNALGRPILDAVRFLNFNRVDTDPETGLPVRTNDTLRAEIDRVYGSKATKYFEQFLIDLNGSNKHQSDDMESLASKMMQNFKIAAVSFSLKSISIQPTSYFRATKVLSANSMTKALNLLSNANGEIQVEKSEKYRKLAQQYSGMAAWKALGYFDVNIGRSLTAQVKGTKTVRDKAIEQGTKGMAFMDDVTIGALYKACLIEVNHSADVSGLSAEEIRVRAGKLLDEVIVKTQVVDSTITRSQNMRSKSFFTKSISAFMSEPTVSLNLLMDAMYGYTDSVKQGMGKWEAFQANRRNIGRSIVTYALTGVASALLEAVFGALRDDDDEEFYKKYLEVFPKSLYENLAVHTKIPYLSDADELANIFKSGYVNISRMEYEGINDVFVALRKGYKLIESDEPITTEKLYAFLKALFAAASSTTGIAFGNILREIEDAWNNTFGAYYDMKLRTK